MNRRHACGPPYRCSGWLPDGRVPASAGNDIIASPSRHAGIDRIDRIDRIAAGNHGLVARHGFVPGVGQPGRLPVIRQSRLEVAAISRSFRLKASSRPAPAVACARGVPVVSGTAGRECAFHANMLFEGAERASDAERPILSAQSAACITLRFPSSRTRSAAVATWHRANGGARGHAANHAAQVAQNGRIVSCSRPESRQPAFWRCLNELNAHDVVFATSRQARRVFSNHAGSQDPTFHSQEQFG